MKLVRIAGAGPAGAAAALAALREGCGATIWERSRIPRHKVCGEFLSPGVAEVLDELGLSKELAAARPARIGRMVLHLGSREKTATLPEPALGLSRYGLDALLLDGARARGAAVVRASAPPDCGIIATGRPGRARRGGRLFGFKAHFRGPAADAVELFFLPGVYIGISMVEDGVTNVCGLAREERLTAIGFDFDSLLSAAPALAARTRPLTRRMDWIATGPVRFARGFSGSNAPYRAGDALGFIDPFTGSGILNALLTGRLAGLAAAQELPAAEYARRCRKVLARPFEFAAILRTALETGWADLLAPLVPARLLFRLTRPRAA